LNEPRGRPLAAVARTTFEAATPGIERMLERQPWEALAPHLLKLSVDIESATKRMKEFARLLLEWNSGVSNLISRNDAMRLVERHILESVEPAHWVKASGAKRWIDLGSGGGFPALPLAMLGVGDHWTLVESRRNKCLFLMRVIQDLKIPNVEVITDRIENLPTPAVQGAFDGFTSRATMTLAPTLVEAARFVAPNGHAFLWKGSSREQEMAANTLWQRDWDFDGLLGIGSGQTAVARFKRKSI
jgi:16S rRNA (guanine527-N7)-methyltransferase